jgi:[protein-PII] uridylyltransferase
VVDNRGSDFLTIVEVYTHDHPGLLYRLTNALYRCSLDIRVAMIATKVDQVVDIFYVRDLGGEKVEEDERLESIRMAIQAVLDGGADTAAPQGDGACPVPG